MSKLTATNCSIGVVTYLGRFESYFQPLIRRLHFLFPDYDINVFINGHYDTVKQIQYLKDITCFLRKYPAIRYVTNLEHQPLARGWNWLVFMAKNDRILILNDDVSFNWEFRHNLENLPSVPHIFTLNGSWSHFVISKDIIRKVGWFDERFLGVGDEDGDYICRLAMEGLPLKNISVRRLNNYVASQEDAGWANFSNIVNEKYSQINREFFLKKWYHSAFDEVPIEGSIPLIFDGGSYRIALREGCDDMPEYYPMTVLLTERNKEYNKNRHTFLINVLSIVNHYINSVVIIIKKWFQTLQKVISVL